jgi:hypothetical protein
MTVYFAVKIIILKENERGEETEGVHQKVRDKVEKSE